jgi:hypothetical protein
MQLPAMVIEQSMILTQQHMSTANCSITCTVKLIAIEFLEIVAEQASVDWYHSRL